MSILLTYNSEPVLVDYSTHKVHLLTFYSRILKVFYVLISTKILGSFFNFCIRYLHSGCLLMRTVVQKCECDVQ